jgi:hypothetical protein
MITAALKSDRRHLPYSNESLFNPGDRWEWWNPDETQLPPSEPSEFDDPSDFELPHMDDARWDVFIADEDECDPLPDHGDFWIDDPYEASDRLWTRQKPSCI